MSLFQQSKPVAKSATAWVASYAAALGTLVALGLVAQYSRA